MKLFNQIQRINLMHKLIKQRRTGTPAELARRLNISTSNLYCILDDLKLIGAPIHYSRQQRTYFYTKSFEINITIDIKELSNSQLKVINGGQKHFSDFSSTTFF